MTGSERTFTVDDLIQLPRFDSAGAITLGDRLLAAARAAPLPRAIQRARDALEIDLTTLRAAVAARMAAAAASDPAAIAEADHTLDGCWTALHDWLTGFSKLPPRVVESTEARTLLAELYPEGLNFVMLPYEREWMQSNMRLNRITNEPLGERIKKLGGTVFIESLQAAHASYGKLLGLPRTLGTREGGTPIVGEAMEAFVSSLRMYALKVTAYVEVDEPGTAQLSNTLLEPLLHWRVSPRPLPSEVEKTGY